MPAASAGWQMAAGEQHGGRHEGVTWRLRGGPVLEHGTG